MARVRAGLSSRAQRSSMLKTLRSALVAGFLSMLCFSGCRSTLGEVETELGQTTTSPLVLAPGTPVQFWVSANSVSYRDAKWLLLHVDMLKGGAVVKAVDCKAYSFSRSGTTTSGCNSGGRQSSQDCAVVVPPSGTDSIRVSSRSETGTASMRGMKVLVRSQ